MAAVNDTTKFVDDTDTVRQDETMIAHMSPLWMSMNDTQGFEQDIKNFLAKPIVLATGNFNITDT